MLEQAQTVQFTVNASNAAEGRHVAKLNTLSGSFYIVKTGYHTLTINRSGGGSTPLPFTLNGEDPQHSLHCTVTSGRIQYFRADPFSVGTGVLAFSSWSDGVTNPTRTFTLE